MSRLLAVTVLLAALAMTVHVVVNQKYVGHMILVFTYAVTAFAPELGIEPPD